MAAIRPLSEMHLNQMHAHVPDLGRRICCMFFRGKSYKHDGWQLGKEESTDFEIHQKEKLFKVVKGVYSFCHLRACVPQHSQVMVNEQKGSKVLSLPMSAASSCLLQADMIETKKVTCCSLLIFPVLSTSPLTSSAFTQYTEVLFVYLALTSVETWGNIPRDKPSKSITSIC